MKELIGFQLADRQGNNIQGDDNDPLRLASFEVLTPEMAVEAMKHLAPGAYLLMPIYTDDIEEHSTISNLGTWWYVD